MAITFSQLGSMGRLGNQLFQIAVTVSTAIRNRSNYYFPEWNYEQYFNLHNCFNPTIEKKNVYAEPYFHYKQIPAFKDADLVGYFQSFKYMEGFEEKIKELLTPTHHFDREDGLCSLHVRRGDYVHQPHNHPTQSMEYYEKAMELSGCSKFLVFSDDIEWCKKNFVGSKFDFAEGQHETIDLAMMAKACESNIICNSSFSWWGAYLNKSPNKKIVAPTKWFGHKLNHDTKDLCPSEWKRI